MELNNKIKKNIKNNPFLKPFQRSNFYWIILLVTIALGYGFTLTNFSMGIDDEGYSIYFGQNVLGSQGRVGYMFTRLFFDSYEYMPIWREILAVVILIIAVTLWVDFLVKISDGKFDDTAGAIFACVAVSCPFLAERFLFSMAAAASAYIYLISIIGVRCFFAATLYKKSNLYLVGSILLFIYGFLYDNSNVVYYFVFGFTGVYLMLMNNKFKEFHGTKGIFIIFFKFLSVIIVSLITATFVTKITLDLMGLPYFNYSSGYVLYEKSHFIVAFFQFIPILIKYFIFNFFLGGMYFYFILTSVVFFIASLFFSYRKKNVYFILGFIGIMMSVVLPFLVTGNTGLPGRILDPIGLVTGFSCSIAYICIKDIGYKSFRIKYVFFGLALILILNQTMIMTKIFYVDYKKYQLDVNKMNQIMFEVEKTSSNEKPIIFLGIPKGYNLGTKDVQGQSLFIWDRYVSAEYELDSGRLYNFFNLYGYNIEKPDKSLIDNEKIKKQVSEMSIFPKEGSVVDYGDYVIVKLGESKLNKNQ